MNPQTYKLYVQSSPGSGYFAIERLANPVPGYREVTPQEAQQLAQQHYESLLKNPNVQGNQAQEWLNKNTGIIGNQGEAYYATYTDPFTGEVLKNVSESTVRDIQQKQADLAAGIIKQVAPGVFVPTGSAGDANQVNIGTNNTANAANTSATGAGSTTSTTGASSSATKPSGINLINTTLNLGSQGDQVKALQQYLSGIGYVGSDGKPLKVDGIYGPETKTAVMQFQSKNGLAPDGIFGPKSLAATKAITSSATQANSAAPGASVPGSSSSAIDPSNPNDGGTIYNTGDPTQDALLAELQAMIKAQQDAGLKINEALNFDQATLNKFLETAKKQVHPFYAQQIDTIKADVLRTAPQILQEYGNEIEKQKAAFESTLESSRESNAERGLAFSGQRARGELGMQAETDRNLAALNQGYGNKLYDLGRGVEEKIGASNMQGYNLGALANYKADLGGKGGFTLGTMNTPYSPGGYKIGSLEYDREAATEARNQALKKTASESVVAGRDYQSLFA